MTDPVEAQFRERLTVLAHFLDQEFNPGEGAPREVGFVLLMFAFGDDPETRMNYISNADLGDVIRSLRNFLRHAEARQREEARARRH